MRQKCFGVRQKLFQTQKQQEENAQINKVQNRVHTYPWHWHNQKDHQDKNLRIEFAARLPTRGSPKNSTKRTHATKMKVKWQKTIMLWVVN